MLLLDTCTLLWLAADEARLSDPARELIRENADSLFVSAISAFEIAVKHRKGALRLPVAPGSWFPHIVQHHGIQELPVTSGIAILSAELPLLHNDPCDRIIVATAHTERLRILTPDPLIRAYPGTEVCW